MLNHLKHNLLRPVHISNVKPNQVYYWFSGDNPELLAAQNKPPSKEQRAALIPIKTSGEGIEPYNLGYDTVCLLGEKRYFLKDGSLLDESGKSWNDDNTPYSIDSITGYLIKNGKYVLEKAAQQGEKGLPVKPVKVERTGWRIIGEIYGKLGNLLENLQLDHAFKAAQNKHLAYITSDNAPGEIEIILKPEDINPETGKIKRLFKIKRFPNATEGQACELNNKKASKGKKAKKSKKSKRKDK